MKQKNENLAQLRQKKNWTQHEVVETLKKQCDVSITDSYYGMIENGRVPSMRVANALARIFEVQMDDIFFGPQHNKTLYSGGEAATSA